MKKFFIINIVIAAALFSSAIVLATPPCPERANRLEDFAYCMRPFPNGRGQVLIKNTSGQMDEHTAALMASMDREVTAPQVYPSIPSAVSFASNMMTAAIVATRWHSPYGWAWMYPGFYFGMGMPIYP